MRSWLAESLVKMTAFEEHETQDLSKRLLSVGPKSNYNSNQVGKTFSYLNYLGLITYRRIERNGFRLLLKRDAGDSETIHALTKVDPAQKPAAQASLGSAEDTSSAAPKKPKKKKKKKKRADKPPIAEESVAPEKPKKKKKKCCDDPHVVRSRKTGKRRCKNCGKKYKAKKSKGVKGE